MEALHSRLTTGEQSGGQEHRQPESPRRGPQPKSPSQPGQREQAASPKPHGAPQQQQQLQQQPKPSRRQNPERKRLRHQRQSVDSDAPPDHKPATKAPAASPPGASAAPVGGSAQSKPEAQEGTPKQKRERKPQRPGKYVCTYCGRACAKPSVLQKHIRSHTGERPYPCAPCGFSFKTKSNLYKHRKSHTHRVKAGLALGEPKSLEEQATESEDETRQLSSASSLAERQDSVVSTKSQDTDKAKDCTGGNSDSYAVKKRLALRLSRGKHALQDSDDKTSSLILGSRGSTESGYFSRSESTEQSQDSPPNTSAKSYAEIILGKYGRLGHLQRMSRHQNQHPTGQEDKSISFTVPKKQVIEHITKLITINEAVVDTSKIDSVKPRRFSLSRKNSSESQKGASLKEALIQSPKAGELGYKNSGSITMGVPCEKFHHAPVNAEQPASQTPPAPLVRSQSMPSAASPFDSPGGDPNKFRQSQSFDERPPPTPRRYGMLKRQPAIEIPLEFTKEEVEGPRALSLAIPDQKQSQPQPYECEACGVGCKDWEGYRKHKQSLCLAHHPRNEVVISQMECSQLVNHAARARASTMRKRRKEESFEFDDPSSPSLPSPAPSSGAKDESSVTYESPRRPALQTCSVIQHTSSFEKQESVCGESQGAEATKGSPPHEEQQSAKPTARKLVRQHSVQVPEILVTEDPNVAAKAPKEPTVTAKPAEKPEEFQWPQRSPSLAQLPIEKLPPKKKRLRLAEAAQSSGDSSFDSISLPRSPSQDSSASYASSRSTSFEEPNRQEMDVSASTPLRRSRAPHMLTVPGVHQHREMRRSASEQAPHEPQPSVLMSETRSKSFDYSCLSPERSAVGWRERRKCLLFRHSAVVDPDEEEEEEQQCAVPRPGPKCGSPSRTPQESSPSASRKTGSSQCDDVFSKWKLSQNIQLTGSTELPGTLDPPVVLKEEAPQQPAPPAPQPYVSHGPSGAARAHYLPVSTGLKLEIPSRQDDYLEVRVSHSHVQHATPHITSSLETLRPVTSPAVAVRLQTDTLTPACAIYTTLSQANSPGPQEAVDAASQGTGASTTDYGNHGNVTPDRQLAWSEDSLRFSGPGGSKRMLSPSNSIELSPESQQQQKRVKEEEEREVEFADKAVVDAKREPEPCLPAVCSPVSLAGPSFPSLRSGTCNSWCYLNYIKPNPSALDEQKPSVYSSWSTSGYDPNPPGLSSKTALSLLHCKQRLSPSIYTSSPMSDRMEDGKRAGGAEVFRDQEGLGKGPPTTPEGESPRKEEDEGEKTRDEPTVRPDDPRPEAWVSERGSSKKCGGGGGTSPREDSTESPPCDCNHCSSTFKATGSLPARSKKHGKDTCRFPQDARTGVGDKQSGQPREAEEEERHRFPGPEKDPEEEDAKENASRRDGRSSGRPPEPEAGAPPPPTSKEPAPKMSASARRAMFARRRLDASASPGDPDSPSGRPPRRSPSPGPRPSPALPSPLPPSARHVSPLLQRPSSPVRGLSPVMVQCRGPDASSGPLGSLTDTSALSQTCFHPGNQPTSARLSADDVVVTHIPPPPTRARAAHNLLSHLPLHSQPPSRSPSLLIPIGGIHMIQPRSTLPLYSLVSSPPAPPASAPGRPGDAPKGRLASLQRRDALKETSPSPPDPKASRPAPAGGLHRKSHGCFGGTPGHPETRTGAPGTAGRRLGLDVSQGQKKAPPSQL